MASRAFVSDVEGCKYLVIKKKTVELSRLFFTRPPNIDHSNLKLKKHRCFM